MISERKNERVVVLFVPKQLRVQYPRHWAGFKSAVPGKRVQKIKRKYSDFCYIARGFFLNFLISDGLSFSDSAEP